MSPAPAMPSTTVQKMIGLIRLLASARNAPPRGLGARPAATTTALVHVAGPGDAEHHRAEDDRADQHLDQRDERVAERLEGHARRRVDVTEGAAGDDGEQHPEVEVSGQAGQAASL